ncbi:hypothetical protein B9Z55_007096 [Caenorhabditis nigoni]|uniref:Homeobox domain-containing protein n=1 Tax=Caenorhabditis nigoni TaxID=1611254 RepID=A0A2G5V8T3_9PELO|nr:hypothetical protein B9Z55_007096 [Caenorhabditis nigoni]
MSSQNAFSTSLARRTRKAPAAEASKGPNPKRRALADSLESEPEVDLRESRPRRKSEKYSIHKDSDSDLDDSPIKRKSVNIRRTEDSKEDDSSSSSSSSLESDSDASIFEDETGDEQPEEPSQPSSSKREQKRKRTDKKRRTRVTLTDEHNQVLLTAFDENPYPSTDQRNKLADETKLTESQIISWFARKRSENLLKKTIFFTVEQKEKLKEAFAVNRLPDESMIASLIRRYFQLHRFKNPPKSLSREEAEPILLELIRENPKFRDYRNAELRERTGWRRDEIKEFFEKYRRENDTTKAKNTTKACPLPEKEAEPILLEIFEKDPNFTDYNNMELKQNIQWKYRRIESWFVRQRKLKHQQEIAQFDGIMETIFQKKQFLRFRNKELEEKTGHSSKTIRNWLRMKRKDTLVSFFKKEISALPEEMANFERIFNSYEFENVDVAGVIIQIERTENIYGDDFVSYLCERKMITEELKQRVGDQLEGNEEEQVEEPLESQRTATREDPSIVQEDQIEEEEEEGVQRVAYQVPVQPEIENDQVEFDNPQFAPIDGEEDDVQPAVPQEAVQMEFANDDIEFNNPWNAPLNEELHEQPVEGPAADRQVPVDVKRETPEIEVKNVQPLSAPVKQEMWEEIENVEEEKEEEIEQLIVFDVMDRNTPEEIESLGPVSILRVQTSSEDLQPYFEDLVGIPEIGFARRSEIAENKRNLDANMESLILPFNCSLNYLGWSKEQVQEFFCQILPPETIRKLVEKVSAGCWLYMFQETEKLYFKRLNKGGSIIDWDQFLTICQELDKIERFKS